MIRARDRCPAADADAVEAWLSSRCGHRLAIGDQGMDVLNREAWICLVEPDRRAVRARCKVDELLEVFSARRWRWVLREFEYKVKDFPDVFGEIGNVRLE